MFLLSPAAHFWPGVVGSFHFFCLYLNFVGPFLCVWRSHWALWHWKVCIASFSFHQVWKFQINVELVHYYTLQKADTVMDMQHANKHSEVIFRCQQRRANPLDIILLFFFYTPHISLIVFWSHTNVRQSVYLQHTNTHRAEPLWSGSHEGRMTQQPFSSFFRSGCVVLSWHSGDEDAAFCSFWILW